MTSLAVKARTQLFKITTVLTAKFTASVCCYLVSHLDKCQTIGVRFSCVCRWLLSASLSLHGSRRPNCHNLYQIEECSTKEFQTIGVASCLDLILRTIQTQLRLSDFKVPELHFNRVFNIAASIYCSEHFRIISWYITRAITLFELVMSLIPASNLQLLKLILVPVLLIHQDRLGWEMQVCLYGRVDAKYFCECFCGR